MLRTLVSAHPSDLTTSDVDAVLDRLAGEVGACGLSLWAVTASVSELRAGIGGVRSVRLPGRFHFRANEAHYSATRCKPAAGSSNRAADAVKVIAERIAARGLSLRLLVDVACPTGFTDRCTFARCKNLLGDVSDRSLCLSNLDVQALILAVARDLSSTFDLDGITWRNWRTAWVDAFEEPIRYVRPLSLTERSLLSVCFCESCHQRASADGLDVVEAQRQAHEFLNRCLCASKENDPRWATVLADAPALSTYLVWQQNELLRLFTRTSAESRCPVRVGADDPRDGPMQAADFPPSQLVRAFHSTPDLRDFGDQADATEHVRLGCGLISRTAGPELVSLFTQFTARRVQSVEIDQFGLLPDTSYSSIKQAIRFARRST